jgi:hypothetical protein
MTKNTKKTYSAPSTVEHGSATAATLGLGLWNFESGSLFF